MKKVLLWLWQLPQNIIGGICSIKAERYQYYYMKDGNLATVYFKKWFRSGVSLGDTIIIDSVYYNITDWALYKCIGHEYGHQRQSKILGPLYLIIIGLPSLLGNIIFRVFKINHKYYYKQPWEAWADKLGGVIR